MTLFPTDVPLNPSAGFVDSSKEALFVEIRSVGN